jgi:hypothetical protein
VDIGSVNSLEHTWEVLETIHWPDIYICLYVIVKVRIRVKSDN